MDFIEYYRILFIIEYIIYLLIKNMFKEYYRILFIVEYITFIYRLLYNV